MPVDHPQPADLALRDIHLPEPVSWWPPAPGWWLLAGLLIIVLTVVFLWRKRKQQKRLQQAALSELETIRIAFLEHHNTFALVESLSILLRRACISFYPRASSASLTGDAWLDYLDKTAGHAPDKAVFNNELGKILASAPYLPKRHLPNIDGDALLGLCKKWLQAQPVKQRNNKGEPA